MGVLASLRLAPMDPLNCIELAARFLASQPGAPERLLAAHTRRADGRCAVCGVCSGRWPCGPASSALLALDRSRLDADTTAPSRGNAERSTP